MCWFFRKKLDINKEIKKYEETENAVLLDVRRKEEYKTGYIMDAINVPLDEIERVVDVIKDKDTPVFAYCLGGVRSRMALEKMAKMGYTNLTNIGGIKDYKGKLNK